MGITVPAQASMSNATASVLKVREMQHMAEHFNCVFKCFKCC